jgi:hypothetical protein
VAHKFLRSYFNHDGLLSGFVIAADKKLQLFRHSISWEEKVKKGRRG